MSIATPSVGEGRRLSMVEGRGLTVEEGRARRWGVCCYTPWRICVSVREEEISNSIKDCRRVEMAGVG